MEAIDELTWRDHLADLIWTYIPTGEPKARNRNQINFRCPFCGDSKKSLTKKRGFYYIDTATYHCFNCEKNATGMMLLKALAPESAYADAVREYKGMKVKALSNGRPFEECDEDGIPRGLISCDPIPAWKKLVEEPDKWEHPKPLTKEQLDYLKSRCVLEQCRGFLSTVNKQTNVPFILIPWEYMGQCIFYQLHNYTGDARYPKYLFPNSIDLNDQEKPVFNIDNVDPSWNHIIACEGVYDALSYKNGVSLGGRVVTEYQWRMLKERWPHHVLVAAFDNDVEGKRSMMKLSSKGGDVKFLDIYPLFNKVHVKDANDFAKASEKARTILKDPAFLEHCMKAPLEMQIGLLLG